MPLLDAVPLKTDVLVVGAGPAGIAAASALNKAGIDVLVLDARKKIGHPLRCGEMVRVEYFQHFGLGPFPGWIRSLPKSLYLGVYSNYDKDFNHRSAHKADEGHDWVILDRKKSEFEASRMLAKKGVNVLEACSVNGVGKWDGNARDVAVIYGGNRFNIKSRMIIAADGPSSLVSRFAGISKPLSLSEVISYYAYTLKSTKGLDHRQSSVQFYNELRPFYFWIFPNSRTRANVGLGVHGYRGHLSKPLLDEMIGRFAELSDCVVEEHVVAWAPSAPPLQEPFADGLLVVGAAARYSGPIEGDGLWQAVVSGRHAGEFYAQNHHLKPTREVLSGYLNRVEALQKRQAVDFTRRAAMELE